MNIHTEAAEAAAHWNGRLVRLITQRENAVFEIALPNSRAALRLHRKGYQSEATIRSELWWCAALAALGVAVPAALPAKDGNLLVKLASGGIASVIAWVEGEPLGEGGKAFDAPLPILLDQHQKLGRLLATVHSTTDRLTFPANFIRPRWDIDGLLGETPFWGRFWDHPLATPSQAATLRAARVFLRDQLSQFSHDIGPIHADVLRENVMVNDGSLSLIDFDDSGIGFRLYDLGTALVQSVYEPAYVQIRDALVAGYAETRNAEPAQVDVFTLARACASVGWVAPRLAANDPIHQSHLARAVMCAENTLP
jgi:Ser/Thr protein kinase RdoA (MazF antagonist)